MRKICYAPGLSKALLGFVLLNLIFATSAFGEKARVERIDPAVKNDSLFASFQISELFSPKITGVLHSGLPVQIELELRLLEIGGGVIVQKKLRTIVTYNIWQEQYALQFAGKTELFGELDKFKKRAGAFLDIFLAPAVKISKDKEYVLRAKANIQRASDPQNKKLSHWLDGAQKRDQVTSQERRSSFSLNLNQLISFFVASGESDDKSAAWQEHRFRLSKLRN